MDLNLVNDGPNVRRKFLDTAIGQIYPLYNEKIRNYMKALNQRNTILRDVKFHSDIEFLLDDFEKSLSVLIKEIVNQREKEYKELQYIKNEKYRRRAELKKNAYLLSRACEIADEVYNEAYEVFLEFQIKMRNAEIERLIEEGILDREELENEM